MPESGHDGNSRVTVAILESELAHLTRSFETEIRHVTSTIERNHREVCNGLRDLKEERKEVTDDHETRLRQLEAGQRRGAWFDVGAWGTALTGLITAIFNGGGSP